MPIPDVGNVINDKLIHVGAFSLLAFLMTWSISMFRPRVEVAFIVLAITIIYGATDEFSQLFLTTRTADTRDWIADIVGAALGLSAYLVTTRFGVFRVASLTK